MVNILSNTNQNITRYGEGINLSETMLTSEAVKTMVKIAIVAPIGFMIALLGIAIAVPVIIAAVIPTGVYLVGKEVWEGIRKAHHAHIIS